MLYVLYNKRQEANDDENENVYDGTKYIRPAYASKYNNKHDIQGNQLMIADENNNWHYLAVSRISGLLRGIRSRHNGDFYCLNCFHSYSTENRLKKHEKICYDNKLWFLKMPDADNNILKSKPGKKIIKACFCYLC